MTQQRSLILIGASARSAAEIAVAAGFTVHAWDLFADSDLQSIADAHRVPPKQYPAGIPDLLHSIPTDVPCLYTGGLENHPQTLDQIANQRPLLGARGTTLRTVRDRDALAQVVRVAGWQMPRPATCEHSANRIVARPRTHCGGGGLKLMTLPHAAPTGSSCEEYVLGNSFGAVYVGSPQGAVLLGVTRQWLAKDFHDHVLSCDQPFNYVGSSSPAAIDQNDRRMLEALGQQLVADAGLCGLFGVDAIRNDTGKWVLIEVNPRFTASIEVLQSTAPWNAIQLHFDAWTSGALPRDTELLGPAREKRIVYADTEYLIDEYAIQKLSQWNEGHRRVSDIPTAGQRVATGRPLATVFGCGATAKDARAAVDATEGRLFELLCNVRRRAFGHI